jgi:hypothetical protein
MDTQTLLAGLSILGNLVLALVVYSLKTTIRVAVLEAVGEIQKFYATKQELKEAEYRLNENIGIRDELRGLRDSLRTRSSDL